MGKKVVAVLLGLTMLSISACGGTKGAEQAEETGTAQAVQGEGENAGAILDNKSEQWLEEEPEEEKELDLGDILSQIETDVETGTPGGQMTAVRVAASLLDWGQDTDMAEEEIQEETENWLSSKNRDGKKAFLQCFSAVDAACQELLGETAQETLDNAGVKDSGYPWKESAAKAEEAMAKAAGLRQ